MTFPFEEEDDDDDVVVGCGGDLFFVDSLLSNVDTWDGDSEGVKNVSVGAMNELNLT